MEIVKPCVNDVNCNSNTVNTNIHLHMQKVSISVVTLHSIATMLCAIKLPTPALQCSYAAAHMRPIANNWLLTLHIICH